MACNPDFNSTDFDGYDFETSIIDFIFSYFIPDRLPVYYRMNDSYKDDNGDGLLIRYLSIFGEELDQEIIPTIECYINIIDAQQTDKKFLTHISDVLGNPPDVFGEDDKYRNLLSYICSIYKIKGTKVAYELFFSILGFNIDITEIEPNNGFKNYDSGGEYDNSLLYDVSRCEPCSYYDITFYPKDSTNFVLNNDMVAKLKAAIKFNEPINAKLRNLTLGIIIEDKISIKIRDRQESVIEELNLYDIGSEYDTDLNYDNEKNGVYIPPLLQTSMTLDVNKSNNEIELLSSIYHNFEGLVDLVETKLNFFMLNSSGNVIYKNSGTFIFPTYTTWKFNSYIIKNKHTIPSTITVSLRIMGTIVLQNGMKANINTLINLGKNIIPLYFI